MTKEINYKERIEEGIPLIKEWLNKQEQYLKQTEDYKEAVRVINEIEEEKDFSEDAYLDIQFILKPFEELPLKIKRIFNTSQMDQYTMFISSRFFDTVDDHINLIMSTKRYQLNMTKFHYNPFPLTKITRNFFTYLKTLYLYSSKDDRFENDDKNIQREVQFVPYYLNQFHKNILEQWTGLKCDDILFDSNIDNWNNNTLLNERIIGKKRGSDKILSDKMLSILSVELSVEFLHKKRCYLSVEFD